MNKTLYAFFIFIILINITGCKAPQNIAYLQNSDSLSEDYINQNAYLYDARIMPKDLLSITVNTTDPGASYLFNLTTPVATTGITTISQPVLQTYLVDNNGQINFPVLGMITLKGLTKRETENKIKELLKTYLKEDPIVTVNFQNYKISVLGEVRSPRTFTIANEKINIFEALAMAGDLTIYGKRENVKIIREDMNGKKTIIPINLNDANLIFSPNYYLQQNDILYVEPNAVVAENARIGPITNLWISAASILLSVASLVVIILK